MRPGAPALDADTLKTFCTGRLAHFKIPRYVHVVDEFPMTVTGKIRKIEMREAAASLFGNRSAAMDTGRTPPAPVPDPEQSLT